jgi:hypothetical protein
MLVTLGLALPANPFSATEPALTARGPREAPPIDVDTILPHLAKLQSIADDNGGNRGGFRGRGADMHYLHRTARRERHR